MLPTGIKLKVAIKSEHKCDLQRKEKNKDGKGKYPRINFLTTKRKVKRREVKNDDVSWAMSCDDVNITEEWCIELENKWVRITYKNVKHVMSNVMMKRISADSGFLS